MKRVSLVLGPLALLMGVHLPSGAVELPPVPSNVSVISNWWKPGVKLPAYVIETNSGFKECPRAWIDAGCREYIPGRDKRLRAYVVKRNDAWMVCPRRNSTERCVVRGQPPNMEAQD